MKVNISNISLINLFHQKYCHSIIFTGQSVLHIACRRNMIDLVQALIKQGAQKNLPDDEGITALQVPVPLI